MVNVVIFTGDRDSTTLSNGSLISTPTNRCFIVIREKRRITSHVNVKPYCIQFFTAFSKQAHNHTCKSEPVFTRARVPIWTILSQFQVFRIPHLQCKTGQMLWRGVPSADISPSILTTDIPRGKPMLLLTSPIFPPWYVEVLISPSCSS